MTWAWIPITIFAALMQTIRTALQKRLTGQLTVEGAAYVRFLYGLPFAVVYLLVQSGMQGGAMPAPSAAFLIWVLPGALAQILATDLLIRLFTLRNFAVGVTYSKTEALLSAIIGFLLLGDTVSPIGGTAIAASTLGLMLLSQGKLGGSFSALVGLFDRPAVMGLASGALFGISAVAYRGAALSLGGDAFLAAAVTLVWALSIQTVLGGIWLAMRQKGQLAQALRVWRSAGWIGLTSMLGSAGWFTAMALQSAAYVKTLGVVEILFSLILGRFAFGEKSSRREGWGIALISLGIAAVMATR